MPKAKPPVKVSAPPPGVAVPTPGAIVVNNIQIRTIDRSPKDIQDLRNAQRNAEVVIYPNRTRLYDLYSDTILDGHLSGIWQKRQDTVINKELHYEDANGQRIEEMDKLIESETFRSLQVMLMEKEAWGLSGMEFIPGDKFQFVPIPRKHIKPQIKVISVEQNDQDGFPYEDNPNLWVVGGKDDFGFLLKCSFYVVYKRGNFGDWAQYVEIFGQPVRIIKYDAYDLKTKTELQQVLDESGGALSVLIPKQAEFEMLDAKTSNGDGQLQEKFLQSLNQELSVIILGNTETTNSSKSSGYAQSKTHGKQQLEITKSDLKNMQNMLNCDKFKAILKSYGYPEGQFIFDMEVDLEDLSLRAAIDLQVATMVPLGDDYWYDTYGIPKPDNFAELKQKLEDEKAAQNGVKMLQEAAGGKLPPPNAPNPTPAKGQKPNAKGQQLNAETSFWDKFRSNLADFFDPAHAK